MQKLENSIFSIQSEEDFQDLAMQVFDFQSKENKVYKKYIDILGIKTEEVQSLEQIPFLPISFYKDFDVRSGNGDVMVTFESSRTTGQTPSKHHLLSEEVYIQSFTQSFSTFFQAPEELCILALLPSYLERANSSLVYMMDHLIRMSDHEDSGFYLDNLADLYEILLKRNKDGQQTLLLGVSFALLDLAEYYPLGLKENISIMETGGMKGRRKEMIREELHETLKQAFGKKHIFSEYGMTELLSQAYLLGNGRFKAPPWMRVLTRDTYDPGTILPTGKSGGINVIDLANIYSCSFIATGDLGRVFPDGSFDILGRFDNEEIRGCNLMVF